MLTFSTVPVRSDGVPFEQIVRISIVPRSRRSAALTKARQTALGLVLVRVRRALQGSHVFSGRWQIDGDRLFMRIGS